MVVGLRLCAVRAAVVRGDFDGFLEQAARVPVRLLGELEEQVAASQHQSVGAHVARIGRFLPVLRLVDLDRHASGDGASNLFLNVEQIREFDIEAIGPKHAFGCRIDEFNRDPKALVVLAQTAAENVTDAKALPNRFGGIGS